MATTKTILKTTIEVKGEASTLILQQRSTTHTDTYVVFVNGGTLPDGDDLKSFVSLENAVDEFKSTVAEMMEIVDEIL